MFYICAELANLEDLDRQHIDQQHSIGEELSQLQQTYNKYEAELVQMDTIKWVDVIESERSREKQYNSDMSGLRVKIETCDKNIEDRNKLISELDDKVNSEKSEFEELVKEQERENIRVDNDIKEVKIELETTEKQHKADSEEMLSVDKEIKELDEKKEEQNKDVEKLEKNITELNMEIFSVHAGSSSENIASNPGKGSVYIYIYK